MMIKERAEDGVTWVNVREAKRLTGHSGAHVRSLALEEKVRAVEAAPHVWLLRKSDLLDY